MVIKLRSSSMKITTNKWKTLFQTIYMIYNGYKIINEMRKQIKLDEDMGKA